MKLAFLAALATAFALPATALAAFTGWTTEKTETRLVATLHAPTSPEEMNRLLAELSAATADYTQAWHDYLDISNGRPGGVYAPPEVQAAWRRYQEAKRRVEELRARLNEARQGERAFDARCVGVGKAVRAHYRQLRCVVVFETQRWQVLVRPLDGVRYSYQRV